jgi:hypothetical protein
MTRLVSLAEYVFNAFVVSYKHRDTARLPICNPDSAFESNAALDFAGPK